MAKAIKVSDFQHRVNEMLDKLNLTKSVYCKQTGIGLSTLSNYVHGNRKPDSNILIKMTDPFMIDPAWLMGYDVPMFLTDKVKGIVEKIDSLDSTEITANEKAMVIAFRKADADTQKMIKRLLAYSEKYGESK